MENKLKIINAIHVHKYQYFVYQKIFYILIKTGVKKKRKVDMKTKPVFLPNLTEPF